jgi:hypothetical protein
MKKMHSPEEMGLTPETVYKYEKAMPYWLQYETESFIQSIVHEAREQVFAVETLLKYVHEDPKK